MATRPSRADLFHAATDAKATLDGSPKAICMQAVALLDTDGFVLAPEDRVTLWRLVQEP